MPRTYRPLFLLFSFLILPLHLPAQEVVTFPSGALRLHGVVYRPKGKGPFPAVVYNHGSAPGMLSRMAFEQLGAGVCQTWMGVLRAISAG